MENNKKLWKTIPEINLIYPNIHLDKKLYFQKTTLVQ